LPTSHTGAWQFGNNQQALAAAAEAGKQTTAPTAAAPRRRVPVPMWAALGVVGSLVLVVAGLRVFAPSTMAAVMGTPAVSTQKTTSALAAIHTDEPATVDALSQTLQPALGDDASVDALVAATLVQAERTRLLAVASALVARTGDTAAADAQAAQVASARQTLQELQARLAKVVDPEATFDESERRWAAMAMAVASSSPPASAESLRMLDAIAGIDEMGAEVVAWRGLVTAAQTLNEPVASTALLDAVTVAADDKRLDGLRAVVAAVAASDEASRSAARRTLLTRQQRSPTDARWRAATQLLDAAEAPVAVAAVTPTPTPTTKPEPAPAAAPAPVEPETFESAFTKGQKAQRNGRSKEAVRLLTTALELKPDDAKATLSLGWAQLDLGRSDAALKSFKAALAAGSMPEAQFGVGETLRTMGRTTDAVAAFEKYLELAPNGPDAETARNAIAALQ
jgi:tetratricopeptide (TPR) repeat protein